ncbi:hypothetical protein ACTFIR_012829 [Dictyostelium discoideum]
MPLKWKCELDAVKHQEESSRMFLYMKQMATFGFFGSFGSFGSFVDPPTAFPTLPQPVPTNSLHEEESYTEEEKEDKELLLNACAVNGISGAMSETEQLQNCKLKIQTDNTTTLSYINHQGGQIQDLSVFFEKLWKLCFKKKVNLIWRAYSRVELQIIVQNNQELQLATEEGNVFIRISPEQSNEQLLNNQNECTPPRL